MEIIENSAIDSWKSALKLIMEKGEDFVDQDKRLCRQILNLNVQITSLDDIESPINLMKSFKDFVYPTKEELNDTVLNKRNASGYEYSYGSRLFNYRLVKNQIDHFIYPLLKQNPNTRRAIAVLYDPLTDSDTNKKTVPGLISVYFKINNSKLDLTVFIRSNDFFIGWPANLYQLHTLLQYLAEKLKISVGGITVFSTSAHVFQEHFDKINQIIKN
jgi:thymidylate synthase